MVTTDIPITPLTYQDIDRLELCQTTNGGAEPGEPFAQLLRIVRDAGRQPLSRPVYLVLFYFPQPDQMPDEFSVFYYRAHGEGVLGLRLLTAVTDCETLPPTEWKNRFRRIGPYFEANKQSTLHQALVPAEVGAE